MKRKFVVGLMVALTGLLFLAVGVLTAAEAPKPPKEILINDKGFKRIIKGPVKFPHKLHIDQKLACTECHHNYENGKNVWKEGDPVKPCIDCHNPLKKIGKIPKLQNAFHKKCKTCHKHLAKAGKKSGPYRKCNQCHQKKKKS